MSRNNGHVEREAGLGAAESHVVGAVDGHVVGAADSHVEREAGLTACDGYVVVVADPRVDEWDAYGPFDGLEATADAVRRRDELDREELTDVSVTVVRLHRRAAIAEQRSRPSGVPRR